MKKLPGKMTSTETHIMALHNGQRVPTLSRMVQVLWFRADLDLGGRLFRQAGKKGRSLLDLYAYLLASSHTQQGAKRAKRYLDFLRHYAPESWQELGIFGPALEIELNSILRAITLEAIEAELDQDVRGGDHRVGGDAAADGGQGDPGRRGPGQAGRQHRRAAQAGRPRLRQARAGALRGARHFSASGRGGDTWRPRRA